MMTGIKISLDLSGQIGLLSAEKTTLDHYQLRSNWFKADRSVIYEYDPDISRASATAQIQSRRRGFCGSYQSQQ
jgi:hypothetical protein